MGGRATLVAMAVQEDFEHISLRELRNDISSILRRVESGERFIVTVRGREVAEIGPLDTRPLFISGRILEQRLKNARADPGLLAELRDMMPETTDDVPIP